MKWFEMIELLDLPSLTSLSSKEDSFLFSRSVTLESRQRIEYWSYLDIPNLHSIEIPHSHWRYSSFQYIQKKSISSTYYGSFLFLDVSEELSSAIPFISNDIEQMDSSVSSIKIPNNSCNDDHSSTLVFSRFPSLELLEMGDECYKLTKSFCIDGIKKLSCLKIGSNSFTMNTEKRRCRSSSFQIKNCESLKTIEIGIFSFSDCSGGFGLKNLPSLQSIKIGTIGRKSYNFYRSSFIIRSMDILWTLLKY